MTEIPTPDPLENRRLLVTILCANIQGLSQLAENMDFQSIHNSINEFFQRLDNIITDNKGLPALHWGDNIITIWGITNTGEGNAELAIRAAMVLQESFKDISLSIKLGIEPLKLKIGIHTGYVIGLRVGINEDLTFFGDAVNFASDLANLAEAGCVVISESTFLQAKAALKVSNLPPIKSKKSMESSPIFLVEGLQDTAGRTGNGGKDNMQTQMVGRDTELVGLEALYQQALHSDHPVFALITGEAGIGKSRLLFEFSRKLQQSPSFCLMSARALAQTIRVPFYLWKLVVYNHFGINIWDPENVSSEKFMREFQRVWGRQLGPVPAVEAAHLIGSLVGIGFPGSPYISRYKQDTLGRVNYAFELIRELLSRIATTQPTVLMLDDLQWADEDTLDLIDYLLKTNISAYKPLPLLILAAARLEFLEQHAPLTEQANVINLNPLELDPRTVADAYPGIRALPEETLKTLASFSKGNPYFLEELVRRVIVSTGEESVESNDDRLVRLRAQSPKTIQELLKMRLEDLPRGIRAMTMLASVSGRVFWVGALDAAIRAMSNEQSDVRLKTPSGLIDASLQDALALLMKAELAFPKVNSNYSGEQAYIFKHDLLREVAYSMLPVDSCSQYHAAVGRWMLGHSEIDFKILAVDQFEIANDSNEAVIACEQAADYYNSRGAVGEAQMLLERARLIRTRAGI